MAGIRAPKRQPLLSEEERGVSSYSVVGATGRNCALLPPLGFPASSLAAPEGWRRRFQEAEQRRAPRSRPLSREPHSFPEARVAHQ